jgi:hypothetical protein
MKHKGDAKCRRVRGRRRGAGGGETDTRRPRGQQPRAVPAKEDRPFRERTPKKRTYGRAEYNDERQFSVRLNPLTDTRLTAACDITGNGPQDFVQTALNIWPHRKKIPYSARQD